MYARSWFVECHAVHLQFDDNCGVGVLLTCTLPVFLVTWPGMHDLGVAVLLKRIVDWNVKR